MRVGPKFKICRRLGDRVFPKAQGPKFTIAGTEKRGKGKRKTMSEYGMQLLEKQKAKYTYGVTEKQFANYVKAAQKLKTETPSANLYKELELRLDNVVYRLGWVNSRAFGRQAVSHGHILVNGRRVTIPSYTVKSGDVISIRKASATNGIFKDLVEKTKGQTAPAWIAVDSAKAEAAIKALPSYKDKDANLNFESILEFYSRV